MADNNQQVFAEGSELKVRRDKLSALKESGNNPFEITKYDVTHISSAAIAIGLLRSVFAYLKHGKA